ncbi:MAG: UDP-N-acetyl-D-mannosamine dehydrogenase [Paracoccaceae bacterium]
MDEFEVCVLGLGYIGLPTSVILAKNNIKVAGVDIDKKIVEKVNNGIPHFNELGLHNLLVASINSQFLKCYTSVKPASTFIIAVPTPINEISQEPELNYIDAALEMIAGVLKKDDLIILESTSPVGTTNRISEILATKRKDLTFPHKVGENADISLAYCPERVLPGNLLYELENNNRIIGGLNKKSTLLAKQLYERFSKGTISLTTAKQAELAKLAENSFRDVNIAFANELSLISAKHGIDVNEVIQIANLHPRVDILSPGIGVGGHCIPVDPKFLVFQNTKEAKLINMARNVNTYKTNWVLLQIEKEIKKLQKVKNLKDAAQLSIGFFGATYKENVDDLRESPAIKIINKFSINFSGKVFVFEPNVLTKPNLLNVNVNFSHVFDAEKLYLDAAIFLVGHAQFNKYKKQIKNDITIIDFTDA